MDGGWQLMTRELQFLKSVFKITEWRDGYVYKTEELGDEWIDQSVIDNNKAKETNLLYAPIATIKLEQLLREGKNSIRLKPHGA
ncbi:MAG: hypothetical protein HMLIMOIP_002066 [Candidatus Nitrosomirales archaeon]|jgi:hypothetical protein